MIRDGDLHTVCQEARCPNQWECFSHRTATFLILGSTLHPGLSILRRDPWAGCTA
jgi:lipoate synthase